LASVIFALAVPAFADNAAAADKALADAAAAAKPADAKPADGKDAAAAAAPDPLPWKMGPVTGDMGPASIKLPEGYGFLDGPGAKKWAEMTSNPVSGKEIGLVGSDKDGWLVLFEFDEVGYVKDDEKNDLNADDLLKDIKDGTAEFNEERKSKGVAPLNVVGWEQKPSYNEAAHALEWCVRAESEGQPSLNFNTRLLGRRGVVSVTLMFGGDQTLAQVLPPFRELLKGFSFNAGEGYSEYRSGDKLAEYGLAALVAGGGVALAAKSGLLAKLGLFLAKGAKLVIFGVAALAAAIGNFFKKLFGKKGDGGSTGSGSSTPSSGG
jgi:uncharacterized membrane-anchored protein